VTKYSIEKGHGSGEKWKESKIPKHRGVIARADEGDAALAVIREILVTLPRKSERADNQEFLKSQPIFTNIRQENQKDWTASVRCAASNAKIKSRDRWVTQLQVILVDVIKILT
jgi:hypothetical protein